MAERQAVWLQDGVATGSQEARLFTESLLDQVGIVGGADLAVTAAGGMNLSVAAGRAFIRKTTAYQGVAHVVNDSADTVTVQASEANPRRDLVVAELTASGWQNRVVKGTAAANPVDPAVPVDSIVLARVNLPASAGSVLASYLEDLRVFAAPLRNLLPGRRNVIRNGDMSVAQRGTGPLAANGAGTAYGLDGWIGYASGAAANQSQGVLGATFPPFRNYLAYAMTTPAAAAGDYCLLTQRIEDVRTYAGKQVTLSFYASSSVAGRTLGLSIRQHFGSGGTPSATVNTTLTAQTVAGALALHTVTFTVPSIAGKTIGSNEDSWLEVRFWLGAGSSNVAEAGLTTAQGTQAAWTLNLTGVQLEDGPVATPFERLPHQQQLAWCQRYYYRRTGTTAGEPFAVGPVTSGNVVVGHFQFPATMRAVPSIAFPAAGNFGVYNGVGGYLATAISADLPNPHGCRVLTTGNTAMTAGQGAYAYFGGASGYIEASAEL